MEGPLVVSSEAWKVVLQLDERPLADLHQLRVAVRDAIKARGGPRHRPGSRGLQEDDLRLRELIGSMGGAPGRGTPHSWKDVAGRWADLGHGSASSEALRKRWERMDAKPSVVAAGTRFVFSTNPEHRKGVTAR